MITSVKLEEPVRADTIERMRRELSMIIPAFRCGRFLPAAVASALHSPVAQVLIAVDASEDDTLAVAVECAQRSPNRVRVLRSERRLGAAGNLNRAADQVATPFFAKLDGDDVLLPGYLERSFELIASHPEVAISSGYDQRVMADEALEFHPGLLPRARPSFVCSIMTGTDAYRFIVRWNPNPCSSGAVYRTAAFYEVGGFDTVINWGEDWEIWLRFAQKWAVAYNDSASALYRIHPGSVTATESRQNRLCFGYDSVYRRAAELCPDTELRPLLRSSFLRVAKLYLGSAARQLRVGGNALLCLRNACKALSSGIAL